MPVTFFTYHQQYCRSSEFFQFRLFADDKTISFADKGLDIIEQKINCELRMVSEWLLANKLSLNEAKTKLLL